MLIKPSLQRKMTLKNLQKSIRMSHGTGSLKVTSQGLSRPFLKTFTTVFPYPTEPPWVSENEFQYPSTDFGLRGGGDQVDLESCGYLWKNRGNAPALSGRDKYGHNYRRQSRQGERGSPWRALTDTDPVLKAFVIPASDWTEKIFWPVRIRVPGGGERVPVHLLNFVCTKSYQFPLSLRGSARMALFLQYSYCFVIYLK